MQAADNSKFIAFPDLGLSPVALHIGPFDLRWYSLAYLAGIFIGYWYLLKLLKQPGAPLARRHADDLVFYAALGIILGGRFGYVLFYNLAEYLRHPIEILKLWDGGMSFHGGVIGTSLGILYFAHKEKLSWLRIHDYVACCVPFGLFFGRLANFINQELWGAQTQVPWAIRFVETTRPLRTTECSWPAAPSKPDLRSDPRGRRPVRILASMFWKTQARYEPGKLVGAFLFFYGLFRFGIEFIREPDSQLIGTSPRHRAAHGPMAVAADDPRRALPDAHRQEAPGPGRADAPGTADRSRDPAGACASRPHPKRRADHRRGLYGGLQRLLLRDPRSARARAAISRPRRKSARCSAS